MTCLEVGKKLVALCKEGKFDEAMEQLYHPEIVSVEAAPMPGIGQEQRGIQAVRQKGQWWSENHTIHSASTEGPFPNGDRFGVHFIFDVTRKQTGERVKMDELALYTVKNGRIVKEEFFYPT